MRNIDRKKRKKIIVVSLLLFGILCLSFLFFHFPKAQREDYRQIFSRQYDTVFLSMYPTDTYREEDFLAYRGMTVFRASYCIPDFSVLKQYIKLITKSGNTISTVYLGIRPDKTDPEKLQELIASCPGAYFEIILAYPSAEYWRNLSEEEYTHVLEAYKKFLTAAPTISNAHVYFMGSQEWLIGNPGNYEDQWLVNESIAQSIMLQCDYLQEYFITENTSSSFCQALEELTLELRNTTTKGLPPRETEIMFWKII